ncbi:MAG: GDSL-type esterase/lipase family protein [Paludisphaera borealis]|uniref:SGNH/GDSL hydrolase family protein n=1 Tax=Paludisphaera borealis TaxID=1387353 RepID=UPI0028501047|nr:GDSL-type esterase/lipase family protein [Paludisphaera borealis]MDR3621003.1 GDSL-type esterase/lipase family protein [Paludisphaera borealis]
MSRPLFQTIRRAAAALRTAWLLLGLTLLLLLALELGLRGVFQLKDRVAKPAVPDARVVRDGYAGAAWPIDHTRELEALAARWEPYVYFRQQPFAGKTITIDDLGRRAVWRPPVPDSGRPPVKILMLGGSSLWGFGARDDQTIPSLLAHSLHERGVAAEIRNLSEIGYVNTQELVALVRELQGGYRPDVVLFYDGVNDTTSALLAGKPTLTTNEVNRVREFNLLQSPGRLTAALIGRLVADSALERLAESIGRRFLGAPATARPALVAADPAVLARGVVDGYRANIAIVDALAKQYGFRPLFVWQPVVFSKAKPVPFEQEEAAKYAWTAPIFAEVARAIQDAADLKARRDFVDLSDVFREADDLVFIDYCHTTEAGNARIAEAVLPHILELPR